MKNEFEEEVLKAMKKFENKKVRITISGIIETRFDIEQLKYVLENGILAVEDNNENYVDIDLDDAKVLYFESTKNNYAMLELTLEQGLEVEIQMQDDKINPIQNRIVKEIEKAKSLDDLFKREVCSSQISS